MKLTRLLFHPRVHWSIHTLRGFLTLLFLIFVAIVGIFLWLSSSAFEQIARTRLIAQLEEATGGRVEIAAFHWKPLSLDAEADDLIIHGNEPSTEDPLRTHRASPRQLHHLRALHATHPSAPTRNRQALHSLIYNLDGSTNIPQPKRTHAADKTSLDELFNLQVGHIIVSDGSFALTLCARSSRSMHTT